MAPPSHISVLPVGDAPAPRVAVLLNANARAVSRRVMDSLSEVVPKRDLYVSRSFEEADSIVAEVMGRGYDTVLTGGGDGTFMGFLNVFDRHTSGAVMSDRLGRVHALAPRPLPRFGVLRLGTGNALAHYSGAAHLRNSGVHEDILNARAGRLPADRPLDLIEIDGVRAPFSGLGYDALVLNNYIRWKTLLAGTPFARFGQGGWGYGLSVALLSIPQVIADHGPIEVEAVNLGADAYRVDTAGRRIAGPVPTGGLLYRGRTVVASVGTCPYYGLGFKAHPAAGTRPGRMQLRLADLGLGTILRRLPAIWRGELDHPGIHDYLVEAVELRFSRPVPFQVGGDAAGWRDRVRYRVSSAPVRLIDFGDRR